MTKECGRPVSTAVSNLAARHRAASLANGDQYQGALALDWANGQAISLSGSSQQSAAFDTTFDRVVLCSVGGASTVVGCWIAVGTNPVASAGAGSMWIAQSALPTPVYVPAGMLIAGLQGATAGTLSVIPALNLV